MTAPTLDRRTTVTIEAWDDPIVTRLGYHATSRYAEIFWLPTVGPTSLWLLRHASYHTRLGAYTVDVDTLTRALGCLPSTSTLTKTFARLHRFALADGGWAGVWRLRTYLPPLNARQLARLPDVLAHAHTLYQAETVDDAGRYVCCGGYGGEHFDHCAVGHSNSAAHTHITNTEVQP